MSWEMIETAGLVVFAALGGIVTVDKAARVIGEWFKPSDDRYADVSKMLANDKVRLDRNDIDIAALKEGQRVLCGGVQALLEHEIHNGNADEMKAAASELRKYLVNR